MADDNNPFDDSDSGEGAAQVKVSSKRGGGGTVYDSPQRMPPDLQKKYDALKAQEAELDRKEAVYDEREQILWDREKSVADKRPANWPPCKPVFRHHIEEDISESWQRLVTFHYYELLVFLVLTVYNTVTLAIALDIASAIGDFFVSLVFIFVLAPFHVMVYRGLLYQSLFKRKSAIMFLWFIFRGLELVSYGYFAFGFPGSGAAGFWNASLFFQGGNDVAGICAIVSASLFTLLFFVSTFFFILVRRRYSELGGLTKAREEARNRAIQTAKENPDLVEAGAKHAVKAARENPDLAVKVAKAAV